MAKTAQKKEEESTVDAQRYSSDKSWIRHRVEEPVTVTKTLAPGMRKPNGRRAKHDMTTRETFSDVVVCEDGNGLYMTRECFAEANILDPYRCYHRTRLGNPEAAMKAAEEAEKAKEEAVEGKPDKSETGEQPH